MVYSKEQTDNLSAQHFAFLKVDDADNVFTITLDRPKKRNAFHQPYMNVISYAIILLNLSTIRQNYGHHQFQCTG